MGNTPSTEPPTGDTPTDTPTDTTPDTPPASPATTTQNTRIAGISVTLSEPASPKGVTFLLPGSLVSEEEYTSTRNVLVALNQVVISFYINVFSASHEQFAKNVTKIFDEYHSQHESLPNKYNVVGHSVGGKISLLLAAKVDPDRIKTVISLDPVDEKPVQFTGPNTEKNLTLKDASADVHITWASATPTGMNGINPKHNAQAIHNANKDKSSFVEHKDAAHFCYTDHGGGMAGWLIRGGTTQGNAAARADAQELIRKVIVE